MTLLAGFAPDGHGRGVLHLAALLARSSGEPLLVGAVIPRSWPPSPARVDAEYHEFLDTTAEEALATARRCVPDDIEATFVVHHARSAPAGLLELVSEHEARAIVLGPLGSTAHRLLHSSPVPVALAPRGFRIAAGARVKRVTVAFGGTDPSLIEAASREAERVGASLRVASFAVRAHAPYTSGVGAEGQGGVLDEWEEEIRSAVPDGLDVAIGHGSDWEDAIEDIEWDDGDVLVVGSSSIGPVAQLFLGSRAAKIIRHAPVPVVMVPR
jgi:nucleotide-binding universal stress UspA family protein